MLSIANKWCRRLIVSFFSGVAGVGGFVNVPAARAAPGEIYNLGLLQSTGTSHAMGINDAGQVAGYAWKTGDGEHAIRYTGTSGAGGTMEDLGTLGGFSYGHAINNRGQVVGKSELIPYGRLSHAFLYTGTPGAGGAMFDLGTLGGNWSEGWGINAGGQVAGVASLSGDAVWRAFRYTGTPGAGGTMVDLGTLGGAKSYGKAINDAGQVTGSSQITGDTAAHAFRYSGTPGQGGVMVDLGTLGGTNSAGEAINAVGQVAGGSEIAGSAAWHAFRYTGTPGAGGAMVDLMPFANGLNSTAHAINDAGFVVGAAQRFYGAGSRPTLWLTDAANTAVDLDDWLDAVNPTQGVLWNLWEGRAYDINNAGLIAGYGRYNDGPGGLSDGVRAYILDVSSLVPEPGTLALAGLALLGLIQTDRRRIRCLHTGRCRQEP